MKNATRFKILRTVGYRFAVTFTKVHHAPSLLAGIRSPMAGCVGTCDREGAEAYAGNLRARDSKDGGTFENVEVIALYPAQESIR